MVAVTVLRLKWSGNQSVFRSGSGLSWMGLEKQSVLEAGSALRDALRSPRKFNKWVTSAEDTRELFIFLLSSLRRAEIRRKEEEPC